MILYIRNYQSFRKRRPLRSDTSGKKRSLTTVDFADEATKEEERSPMGVISRYLCHASGKKD